MCIRDRNKGDVDTENRELLTDLLNIFSIVAQDVCRHAFVYCTSMTELNKLRHSNLISILNSSEGHNTNHCE